MRDASCFADSGSYRDRIEERRAAAQGDGSVKPDDGDDDDGTTGRERFEATFGDRTH